MRQRGRELEKEDVPLGLAAVSGQASRLTASFDLAATLASGQVFRWREHDPGAFLGWIGSDIVSISQQDSQLIFQGTSKERVRTFFSLDVDLSAIAREMDVDEVIHQALNRHWGLRVIQQDPWECLASFILSSFNNIPRLTGMIERLATRFGEPMGEESKATLGVAFLPHRFPKPEALARVSERVLRNCGLGFRAPYVRAAAQAVADGRADLERWRGLDDEALRRALMTIPGVGEKVVECVTLFGYNRTASFPVDVWIGRAMRGWYFPRRKVTDRQIRAFARRRFGPHCGWAQQFLYCRARATQIK